LKSVPAYSYLLKVLTNLPRRAPDGGISDSLPSQPRQGAQNLLTTVIAFRRQSSVARFAGIFRFQLSLRDIEELLFERGGAVSYETVRRWCNKFGACFAHRVKAARRKPGTTWHLDEVL
jgi:hypothetical protein